MNFENIGLSVLKVMNENDNEKKYKNKNKIEKIICVEHNKNKVDNYFEEYKCKEGEYLQMIPPDERERSVSFVAGQSGSGKTYWSKKYIEEYKKKFKKRNIYVFSFFDKDKSLNEKYLKRIRLNDEFINTPLDLEDFADSLCLFDDIDTIRNKKLKDKLKSILNSLLELGRHHNVDVIYISHQCNKGWETKCILNECTSITIFPKTMSANNFKYLLSNYFGMDKTQLRKINSLDSRAVTIIKSFPTVIAYDKGCYVLKNEI